MDFLDPKKKRAHRRRLMLGYGLIAVVLSICTLALVFVTNGYGIDRKGTIIQNGLIFVSAHPVGANIFINDKAQGTTDGRFVLQEGKYKVTLQQKGYRNWERDVSLEGSSIERLVYPFMFPQTLSSHDIEEYASLPDMVSTSPDRHWIVSHIADSFNNFIVTDASTKDNASTTIVVPTSVLIPHPGSQKIELVEWSTDNQHFLIKDTYDGGVDFVIVDRSTPANSVNLTQVFGHSFTKVSLRDKRFDQLYVYDAGTGLLEAADVKAKTLDPVGNHILAYWPFGSGTLVYVTDDGAPSGKVFAKILDGGKSYILRTLPSSSTYLLNMATFGGHQYVAVGTSAESRVYLYEDPLDMLRKNPPQTATAKALLKVDTTAEFVSFSANTRFIAVQGGSKFAVYDAENNRQFRYDTNLKLQDHAQATWMDGHRLMLVSDNKLHIFDFDGTNDQTLTTNRPGYAPAFDRDYTALFTVSPSTVNADKTVLLRTELIVK